MWERGLRALAVSSRQMSEQSLVIVGLGPAGLEHTPPSSAAVLADPMRTVIVRTLQHPAAMELDDTRDLVSCDDLYESGDTLDDVYIAIANRVILSAASGSTVYAVPGSPHVGERSVAAVMARADSAAIAIEVVGAGTFLDLVWARIPFDPIARGVQIVDGRDLPDPFPLHLPTLITQVDRPVVLADVALTLAKVLSDHVDLIILDRLGDHDEIVLRTSLSQLSRYAPGPRTSVFLDPPLTGWHGLVLTSRRLRRECPWDREQTHRSLLKYLIEEAYEAVDAANALSEAAPFGKVDFNAYAHLEEELGDVLLQIVLHATLAREASAFDVEEIAEMVRRKLVIRHPHVYGDIAAPDVETVAANWEQSKATERHRISLMDDVPTTLPAALRADKLQRRAAFVGFDWDNVELVLEKLYEELGELSAALGDQDAAFHELGDVMFGSVNVARHLGMDSELVLRQANDRFEQRFRHMEASVLADGRALREMSLEELNALWADSKESGDPGEGRRRGKRGGP